MGGMERRAVCLRLRRKRSCFFHISFVQHAPPSALQEKVLVTPLLGLTDGVLSQSDLDMSRTLPAFPY